MFYPGNIVRMKENGAEYGILGSYASMFAIITRKGDTERFHEYRLVPFKGGKFDFEDPSNYDPYIWIKEDKLELVSDGSIKDFMDAYYEFIAGDKK